LHRSSGNEEQIKKYIIDCAVANKLEYRKDKAENIVVRKRAVNGASGAKPVILQSHMDMVCEAHPELDHDFSSDPIKLKIDGEWLTADNTTLGADNGIGLAAALAILESKTLKHGPLECLFTATEETGMFGALGLESDMLSGKTMINLDAEGEGLLFVGCAGGRDTIIDIPIARSPLEAGYKGLRLEISGLRGGHSGTKIHEQRGNALKLLAWTLYSIHGKYDICLSSVNGGSKRNVIPSEAVSVFAVKENDLDDVIKEIEQAKSKIGRKMGSVEPELEMTVKETDVELSMGRKRSGGIVAMLHAAPHGVVTMSYDIDDLVQTSTNMAVVRTDNEKISVQFLSRSSSLAGLERITSGLSAIAELVGGSVSEVGGYPGWQPNLKSEVLNIMKKTYEDLFGKEARHVAVHAGLECGIIGEKFPGIDMVSFGPEIKGAHSIAERVHIGSVNNFWKLLTTTLEKL